ncbi:thioredoxin family protein [Oceanobacillus kimchii]|uniref:thioredoxin family protein n=1 Tax=Oceanobacillus TaxID=182709 RepID=UPI0003449C39|nr:MULTISPECIES: thioredoxin family protein [Oceanobacillus]MCT1577356.1 thioredoxin family protein [Oceanobacillus kimchii]MCT2136962.1 thioredoxin family protein [Oceanobacillus kimchii]OEH53561.1 thioredoxin [Oceanobacillus sp. E9]
MKAIESVETFNEIIASEQPVIIKFYADWCPDCKRMDMFIDGVIEEFNNYDWYEVNSDEVEGLAEKYEVMGIPSMLIFKNGEKIAHQHSAYTKSPESVSEFLHQQLD